MTIWACTSCGSPNGSIAQQCFRCGAPRPGVPAAPDEPSLVPLAQYDVLPPAGQAGYAQPGHDPAAAGYAQPGHDPAAAGYAPAYPDAPAQVPQAGPYDPARAAPYQQQVYGTAAPYETAPGYADPGYPPPPGGERPRQWWVPVLIGLVVLLAVGAVTTVVLVGRDDGEPRVRPSTQTGTAAPSAASPTGASAGPATPTTPASVGVVAIDPGVTDPRAADVAAMFDSHFAAVNAKNYAQALAAYDPAGAINPNDAAQAAAYQRDVSTTTDDQIVLRGIGPDTTGKGVLAARVTFRSTQQAGYGPKERPNEACTAWDVTYTISRPGGVYKIFAGKATNSPC
jgi:hypothetical protein